MATTRIDTDSSTVHTVSIVIPDDVLARIQPGDEVRIQLVGRGRLPQPLRLSESAIDRLTDV